MACKSCGKNNKIVNSHFELCFICNSNRLKNNKKKNDYDKSYFVKRDLGKKPSKKNKIEKDEKFYEICFNNSNHKCEECNVDLPNVFRGDDGRIVARWRYSHIIPKSIAPKLRHVLKNINHLCLKHHMQWENGDKENMRIYRKNKKRLPMYF